MRSDSSLLGIIADSVPEAVLIFSSGGRLEAVNAAATALTGVQAAAVGEVTLAELLGDRAAAEAILAAARPRTSDRELGENWPALHSLKLYSPACGQGAFRAESWRFAVGTQEAVSVRLFESEAAQHGRVLTRIAEGLAGARNLPVGECRAAGLATAITEVCVFTGWAYAEAWIPAAAAPASVELGEPQWTSHPFWYGSRERYRTFRALSIRAAESAPLPLISGVARNQSSSWYSDVSVVPLAVYRRARAAREAGLKATFAQPIVEGGRTLAVLVFMMAEARARDEALADLMAAVARQLAPLFRTAPRAAKRLADAAPRLSDGRADEGSPSDLLALCRLLDGLGKAAVIVAHESGGISWVNAAACQAFGYAREELIGLPIASLHSDARSFEEFARRAQRGLKDGKPFRQCFRMRREDGSSFASEHLVVPLGEVAGATLSVSLVNDLGESAKLAFGRRLDQLSVREQEVFQLTIVGATVTEIAARLDLSARTVETHRSHLLRKLGCASTNKLLAELLADWLVEHTRL